MGKKNRKIRENSCFPKKLILLGQAYRIKSLRICCKKCGRRALGEVNLKTKTIELDKHLNEKTKKYVLFHELGHLFAEYYDLEQSEIFAEAFARYVGGIISQLKH